MDNTYGSDYDRLLAQMNEEMGYDSRDMEKEIRIMFEDTDMGRQLDINEWDVVFENDQWWVVADNGSQWAVTETEGAETPFQFNLVSETKESRVDESGGLVGVEFEEGGAHWKVTDDPGTDRVSAVRVDHGTGRGKTGMFSRDFVTSKVNVTEAEDKEEEEEKDKGDHLKGKMDDLYKSVDKGEEGEEKEKTTDDFLAGGRADDVKNDEFNSEQLRIGQHHELEHTDNPAVALEIAKDHLREDPIYYTKLKRMESGECDHPEDVDLYKKMGRGKSEVE